MKKVNSKRDKEFHTEQSRSFVINDFSYIKCFCTLYMNLKTPKLPITCERLILSPYYVLYPQKK